MTEPGHVAKLAPPPACSTFGRNLFERTMRCLLVRHMGFLPDSQSIRRTAVLPNYYCACRRRLTHLLMYRSYLRTPGLPISPDFRLVIARGAVALERVRR